MIVKTPEARRPGRPRGLVYLFSRIWFGTTLLALIVLYASIVSAIKPVRGVLELSEMQAFHHWLFAALVLLFCVSLSIATWVRIRWNLTNLGVLTVHTGLLILVGGSLLYFGGKVEGAALLRSPRIELVGASGSPLGAGALLARKGEGGEINMPALGGRTVFEVTETEAAATGALVRATVRVTTGGVPRDVMLVANGEAAPLGESIGLRLIQFEPTTHFYDREEPALYVRDLAVGREHILPVHGLPWSRERFTADGEEIRDARGARVESGRIGPQVTIAGVPIPTGWFERWRMPIPVDAGELPLDIEITGYVPYVERFENRVLPGGDAENPVAQITISDTQTAISETLAALDPRGAVWELGIPVEFAWVADALERDALLRNLAGPHELEIEVLEPPARMRVAIESGQTIAVEGTDYTLTIGQLAPSWPLMSPGFEGARSPMASVDVVGNGKRYNRTVIERFPALSQDIDESGVRHRDGPYDANLRLRYRTSERGKIMLVAGPDLPPVVATFEPDGVCRTKALAIGQPTPMTFGGDAFGFTLHALERHGTTRPVPVITPSEVRRPDMERTLSAVRVRMTAPGAADGWSTSQWVSFTEFPGVGEDRPVRFEGPDGKVYEVVYSRLQRDLGFALVPGRLTVEFFPGRESVESWRSEFHAVLPDKAQGVPAAVYTNATATFNGWTLFQSGAAGDHWSYTILGVGNRRGIWPMLLGCTLITLGSLYAFYAKPVLIRRRKARGLAEAERPAGSAAEAPPAPAHAMAETGTSGE